MNDHTDRRAPAMSRTMQWSAVGFFFLIGAGLTAFLLLDPLGVLPWGRVSAGGTDVAGDKSALPLYTCPMHPQVLQHGEGDCPICLMDLVPVEEPDAEEPQQAGEVAISPEVVQTIGVVSEAAIRSDIARTARTVGILDFNSDRITWINTKYSGWIEKVHVSYVGETIEIGQPLFDIYSPDLVTTQEEYLRAIDYRDSLRGSRRTEARRQAESLLRSTRARLDYWDVGPQEIERLEQTKRTERLLTVRSQVGGIVAEVMQEALEGMFVNAGMNLYKIADMSTIWVHADVFESDLGWVRAGQSARVSFPFEPDRTYDGRVLFLYPEVSQDTRTLKLCVEISNPGGRLRSGMFADVTIEGPRLRDAVLIPDSAVLRSGERSLVFVDRGEGRYAPREVVLGLRDAAGRIEVRAGIEAGEAVVTQAQFLLDSESRVREAIARFSDRGAAAGSRP